MADPSSVSIVVPAFNEEPAIGRLVQALRAGGAWHEIIVVDDGSSDATAERARDAGATVARHPYNKGNGTAVKTGIRRATGEFVLTARMSPTGAGWSSSAKGSRTSSSGRCRRSGRPFFLGDTPFTVIGVMQPKLQNTSYQSRDKDRIFIPVSTHRALFGQRYLNDIVYRTRAPEITKVAERKVYETMGRKYQFDPDDKDALSFWDTSEWETRFGYMFLAFNIFFAIAEPDTTNLGMIDDLATTDPTSNTMGLTWTAPCDDGDTGTANAYEVRYSLSPIDEDNWQWAVRAGNEPAPSAAGSAEAMEVRNLIAGQTYLFEVLKISHVFPS